MVRFFLFLGFSINLGRKGRRGLGRKGRKGRTQRHAKKYDLLLMTQRGINYELRKLRITKITNYELRH